MTPKEYMRGVVIALDQLGNAFAAGRPDETISSRLEHDDFLPFLKKALNRIDPGHTLSSQEFDDLGLPDPHHLGPSLAEQALRQVMLAGDAYLSLPDATNRRAEVAARLQRLREKAADEGRPPVCDECGQFV